MTQQYPLLPLSACQSFLSPPVTCKLISHSFPISNLKSSPPSSSMARSLTLARFPPKSFSSTSTPRSSSLSIRALARRFLSAYGPKAQLIELDLDSSSSSSSCDSSGDVEVLAIRKLEDVIHNIIVRRSAPDWLPFRPGSSYWVPPKPRGANIVDLVDKLANPLTEEETLSFTSVRGWPCSTFFLQGIASPEPVPMQVEVYVHVQCNADKTSKSDEE